MSFIQCLIRSPPEVESSIQVMACLYSLLSSFSTSGRELHSGDSLSLFSFVQVTTCLYSVLSLLITFGGELYSGDGVSLFSVIQVRSGNSVSLFSA
jgi:hypothetical protein